LDPWGGMYKVWPGPWRYSTVNAPSGTRWPIPFRIFTVESGSNTYAVKKDNFVLKDPSNPIPNAAAVQDQFIADIAPDDAQTLPPQMSYPADGNKSVFIWSYGENGRNSQMLYQGMYDLVDPGAGYDQTKQWFYTDGGATDIGGGDDVNNWDTGTSWQRFYM
jgi:hypothetical protein